MDGNGRFAPQRFPAINQTVDSLTKKLLISLRLFKHIYFRKISASLLRVLQNYFSMTRLIRQDAV